jgi:hypothetical protein
MGVMMSVVLSVLNVTTTIAMNTYTGVMIVRYMYVTTMVTHVKIVWKRAVRAVLSCGTQSIKNGYVKDVLKLDARKLKR